MSYITRAPLSLYPTIGGVNLANGSPLLHIAGYGSTSPDDYDLVTIVGVGSGYTIYTGVQGVAVMSSNISSTSPGLYGVNMGERLHVPVGGIVSVSSPSGAMSAYGYVHRVRQNPITLPANGSTAAYITGFTGTDSPAYSGSDREIYRFDYTSETASWLSSLVAGQRTGYKSGNCSGAWTSSFGYFIAGRNTRPHADNSHWDSGSAILPVQTTSYKLTFSTQIVTTVSAVLSSTNGKGYASGVVQDSTRAHILGGYDVNTTTRSNRIDKFTFSGETLAASGVTLPTVRSNIHNATLSNTTKGFYFGGHNGTTYQQDIGSITHATSVHTTESTSQFTALNCANACALHDSTYTYGYVLPGVQYSGSSVKWRFVFSTATTSAVGCSIGVIASLVDGSAASSKSSQGYVFQSSTHWNCASSVIWARTFNFSTESWRALYNSMGPSEVYQGDGANDYYSKCLVTS